MTSRRVTPTSAPPDSGGFRVRLEGTQLSDLIQLQCSVPGRSKVELRASNTLGRLFFDQGRVVHATFGDRRGLDAVVEMLRVPSGRLYPASCQWPVQESLAHGPEQLLLQAAQRLDESAMGKKPASDPVTGVVPSLRSLTGIRASKLPASSARSALVERHSLDKALAETGDVPRVDLSSNGSTQRLTGGATTNLSDLTFFAQQAADQIGTQLGLGPCRALSGFGEHQSLVVFRDSSLTGVLAPSEATVALAKALGVE